MSFLKYEFKKCPQCGSRNVKKDGKNRQGIQRYRCRECNKRFQSAKRNTNTILIEYVLGKQTYKQIYKKYGPNHKQIQKLIDNISLDLPKITPRTCVIGIDTTWFGDLGLTLVRDLTNKENLRWRFVSREQQLTYSQLVEGCVERGVTLLGIVADGKDSFFHSFGSVPIQMCQFHMAHILRRYLTKNPNLECNKELWKLWYTRENYNQYTFRIALLKWFLKHSHELVQGYIREDTNTWEYSKERTLKAYKSLVRFTRYLFTYQTSRWIPNTNNSLEGVNSDLKNKIRNHNGLRWDRKARVIHFYLLNQSS